MNQLNGAPFLRFLEVLTSTPNIIPDAAYNDCGLHSTGKGGRLMIHTDASRHPIKAFHQHYNLIFFINPDWKEEYGGHLELWSRDGKRCEKKILPIANRCVLFDTGSSSFHGHPHPLNCPEDRRRNSLAVYYYVLDRSKDPDYSGFQSYVAWKPMTAGETIHSAFDRSKFYIRQTAKALLPPILFEAYRFLKRQLKK